MKIRNIKKLFLQMALLAAGLYVGGCSKSQSYSELLRDEEHAVNWYLANYNVALDLPEDSKDLLTAETIVDGKPLGENAPFYKIDAEGYVYMQVVRARFSDPVDEGDLVYFRYERESILDMFNDIQTTPGGNSEFLPNGAQSFVYRNTYLPSTTKWGTGVQMPLQYMGYDSEVNLVLKSYYGFTEEQAFCVPYLINIRYFKPEY